MERNQEQYTMSQKMSFEDKLLLVLAAIGGFFLFADYYKRHTIKKIYYHCPHCNVVIQKNENPCHQCGSRINWS
jgi:hypothetical protein